MVLAMARPWQRSLQEYAILDAFVKQNIGMVLNLQEVGNKPDSCRAGAGSGSHKLVLIA
jgi:hypothetical protein